MRAMTVPAFAWARERGAALGLLPSDRLLLMVLADRANGALVCWPGQPCLRDDTGLSLRTIRAGLPRLEGHGLIRIEAAVGRPTRYHILRPTPANGHGVDPGKTSQGHTSHPGNMSQGNPGNPSRGNGTHPGNPTQGLSTAPAKRHGVDPGNSSPEPRQNVSPTPAIRTPEPLSEPKRTKTRERAKEESDLHRLQENGTGEASTYGSQRDADELAQFTRQRLRLVEPVAEPDPGDAPADPEKVRKAVAAAVRSMRKFAQPEGVKPVRDVGEQLRAFAGKPERPLPKADPRLAEHLAAARADLARRAAERVNA